MENILMLSLARHDDVNTSATFELANEFVRSNQVLIMEHPYTWTELLRGLTNRKGLIRLLATLSSRPMVKSKGKVKVLVPPAVLPTNFLPFGKWYKKLVAWNHQILAKRMNRWLTNEKWANYHYINSYNYHFPLLGKHLVGKQGKKVYHCVDPIVKPYTMKHGLRNEEEAVANADIVISTAPQLQRKWQSLKPSFLVPNAVNYRHFSFSQEHDVKIRGLGNKIVGYFGAIERRIDYEELIVAFKANPDWTLVMAGPVEDSYVPREIKSMHNVHFIGAYTYSALSSMIHAVDATIIPFKMDEAAKSIYPLKLYEYLSSGKPLVCTLFNPDLLLPIADKIHIAEQAKKLGEAIENALNDLDIHKQLRRKSFASMNTWEHRAKRFLDYLKD